MIIIYAYDTYNYSNTISLSNSVSWTANVHTVTLDFNAITANIGNTTVDIGYLPTTLTQNVSAYPPNVNNYTFTFSANSYQTGAFIEGGVNPTERQLLIQTTFTSNTGTIQHANNLFLTVKNTGQGAIPIPPPASNLNITPITNSQTIPATGGIYVVTNNGITITLTTPSVSSNTIIIKDATGVDPPTINIIGNIDNNAGGTIMNNAGESLTLIPFSNSSLSTWYST